MKKRMVWMMVLGTLVASPVMGGEARTGEKQNTSEYGYAGSLICNLSEGGKKSRITFDSSGRPVKQSGSEAGSAQ